MWWQRQKQVNHIISECSKLAQKKYKSWHDYREGDQLRVVQKIEILTFYLIVFAQTMVCPSDWDT